MRKLVATGIALVSLPTIALLMPDTGARAGTFPGNNGRIAFTVDTRLASGSTQQDVATVKPDGTGFANLTPTVQLAGESPDWSADHAKIAFIGSTDEDPNGAIYTMDADGTDMQKHTNGAQFDGPAGPAWSPDGTRIVFSAPTGGGFGLWILTLSNNSTTAITTNTDNLLDKAPAWSPDGSKIAYTFVNGNNGAGSGIYVVNTDGTGETLLSGNTSADSTASWNPAGTRLVFDSDGELSTVNASGGGEQVIPNTDFGIRPAWSPDGLKVVYTDTAADPWALRTINVNGSSDAQIFQAATDLDSVEPVWGGFEAASTPTSTTASTTTTTTAAGTTSTTATTVKSAATTTTTRPPAVLPRTGGNPDGWVWVAAALALVGLALVASTGTLHPRVGAHFTRR